MAYKSEWCHTIEVKGPLSYFFPRGIDITEDIAKSIVGKPIRDMDGKVIGKIDSINWETGEWFGRIVVSDSIQETICENYEKSMEVVVDKEKNDEIQKVQ